MGHGRALPGRALAEPRGEGRGVEQVAGVEQGRQQDHSRPGETCRDVAHGRELGRAGEDEHAHRHRLDRAEARAAGRQAVDEAEARGGRRRSPAIPPPGVRRGALRSSEAAAMRPVSAGRSWRRSRHRRRRGRGGRARTRRRGAARAALGRALPDPPAVVPSLGRGESSRRRSSAQLGRSAMIPR